MSPRVNVAYQWNGSSVLAGDPETGQKADLPAQVLYAFGADVGVSDRFSLTGDWLGRWAIDSPRVDERTFTPRDAQQALDTQHLVATVGDEKRDPALEQFPVERRIRESFGARSRTALAPSHSALSRTSKRARTTSPR